MNTMSPHHPLQRVSAAVDADPLVEGLPVLALTVLREVPNRGKEVLVVVRRPEVNLSHGNVVCVPTQRIPGALFDQIIGGSCSVLDDGVLSLPSTREISSDANRCDEPLVYAIDHILARKLELGATLEYRGIAYRGRVMCLAYGQSEIGTCSGWGVEVGPIALANASVVLTRGADLF